MENNGKSDILIQESKQSSQAFLTFGRIRIESIATKGNIVLKRNGSNMKGREEAQG